MRETAQEPTGQAAVEAVIVNHNTSRFAEIALRSLSLAADRSGPGLRVTVVDNHSIDETRYLRAAVDELGAGWETSRWPAGRHTVNTHGDVLRDFVLSRAGAAGFLFVDSDICFLAPSALAVMRGELAEDPSVWAVGARLITGRPTGPAMFREAVHRKRRPLTLTARIGLEADDGTFSSIDLDHAGRRIARCHPACALIRNSDVFQLAVRHLGLSAAWTWSNDRELGGLSDTLALVSNVMRTHRRWHRISTASVIHFWHGTSAGFRPGHEELLTHLRRGDVERFVAASRDALVS
jgi:hypothetical protein